MFEFTKKQSTPLIGVSVTLGTEIIHVPVASLKGNKSGPTLLITGGNDGDEYAGITACYRIIEEFSHIDFSGTLTVIPVVNIPGFKEERSFNPMDGKYPKHIYPGKQNGTPSEQLRYWLSGYIKRSDFWIDLHGGSLTERVYPYVHAWKSHVTNVDQLVEVLLRQISAVTVLYRDIPDYTREIAQSGCGYLMCESGSFGEVSEKAINTHLDWIHTTMGVLNMITTSKRETKKHILTNASEYVLKKNGVWFSSFPKNNTITKEMTLGIVRSMDGNILETVTAKQDGMLLWAKEGMRARSGDSVAGVGHSPLPNTL